MDLHSLSSSIDKFARDRDWEQFHNPKDLAIALGIEVSELQELMLRVGPRQRIVRNNWRGFGKVVLVCANRENAVAEVIHQFKATF